jgi:hypothetical protein
MESRQRVLSSNTTAQPETPRLNMDIVTSITRSMERRLKISLKEEEEHEIKPERSSIFESQYIRASEEQYIQQYVVMLKEHSEFINLLMKEVGTIPTYLATVEILCQRIKNAVSMFVPCVLLCDLYHIFVIRGQKLQLKCHIAQVVRIHSLASQEMTIECQDIYDTFNISIRTPSSKHDIDELIRTLLEMWNYNYPYVLKESYSTRGANEKAITDNVTCAL